MALKNKSLKAPKPQARSTSTSTPTKHKHKSSSTTAQNGSAKGGHSSPSKHKHSHASHPNHPSEKEAVAERFFRDERDYKSWTVEEYDAHQDAARRRHEELLIDVLERRYG